MLVCARCGIDKKRARTRYAELVFLHPVGSAGHVMYSGASGSDVDINTSDTSTHNQIYGSITWARARQLNN
jgi:hypothetical protein